MKYNPLFLSFRGRIGRMWYWIGTVLLTAVSYISNFIAGSFYQLEEGHFQVVRFGETVSDTFLHAPLSNPINLSIWIVQIILGFSILYAGLAIQTKRWHDRNKSGWWSLILFVPVIGWLWTIVECGFLRGNEGTNRFGSDPFVDPVAALDRRFGYEL